MATRKDDEEFIGSSREFSDVFVDVPTEEEKEHLRKEEETYPWGCVPAGMEYLMEEE